MIKILESKYEKTQYDKHFGIFYHMALSKYDKKQNLWPKAWWIPANSHQPPSLTVLATWLLNLSQRYHGSIYFYYVSLSLSLLYYFYFSS